MLLWLSTYLEQYIGGFHVIQYLTLRGILSALTALVMAFLIGPVMIKRLNQYEVGQTVRHDGPQTHFTKAGTPTMGGALILVAVLLSCLLWGDLTNHFLWIVLFVTMGFGLIGGVDDYRKLIQKNTKGLPGRWKLFWQTLIALSVAVFLYKNSAGGNEFGKPVNREDFRAYPSPPQRHPGSLKSAHKNNLFFQVR